MYSSLEIFRGHCARWTGSIAREKEEEEERQNSEVGNQKSEWEEEGGINRRRRGEEIEKRGEFVVVDEAMSPAGVCNIFNADKLLQLNIGLTQRGKDAKTQRIHFRFKTTFENIYNKALEFSLILRNDAE